MQVALLLDLLSTEERAANVVIWGTCAIGTAAFLAALVAMSVLK